MTVWFTGIENLRIELGLETSTFYLPPKDITPDDIINLIRMTDIAIKNGDTVPVNDPIYIRDQAEYYANRGDGYKFHITGCKTLRKFINDGNFDVKYVSHSRKDGFFTVNILHDKNVATAENRVLKVCQNCLEMLNYNNFASLSRTQKREFITSFSLEDFLESYQINTPKTKYTDETSPTNLYSDNWRDMSAAIRKELKNTCQNCWRIGLTHVHHKNSDKTDNRFSNLHVVCEDCHNKLHSNNMIFTRMSDLKKRG
jgi:hypothetical protein